MADFTDVVEVSVAPVQTPDHFDYDEVTVDAVGTPVLATPGHFDYDEVTVASDGNPVPYQFDTVQSIEYGSGFIGGGSEARRAIWYGGG